MESPSPSTVPDAPASKPRKKSAFWSWGWKVGALGLAVLAVTADLTGVISFFGERRETAGVSPRLDVLLTKGGKQVSLHDYNRPLQLDDQLRLSLSPHEGKARYLMYIDGHGDVRLYSEQELAKEDWLFTIGPEDRPPSGSFLQIVTGRDLTATERADLAAAVATRLARELVLAEAGAAKRSAPNAAELEQLVSARRGALRVSLPDNDRVEFAPDGWKSVAADGGRQPGGKRVHAWPDGVIAALTDPATVSGVKGLWFSGISVPIEEPQP